MLLRKKVYPKSLSELIQGLVDSGSKVGIIIMVPEEKYWAKDPVTGAPVTPRESKEGSVLRYRFTNDEVLRERFNLSECKMALRVFMQDLSDLILKPDSYCTHALENNGTSIPMVNGLIKEILEADSQANEANVRYHPHYRANIKLIDEFKDNMHHIGNWGCAVHKVQLFHHGYESFGQWTKRLVTAQDLRDAIKDAIKHVG